MNKYRKEKTSDLLIFERCLDFHVPELIEELCRRAGLLEELVASKGETFESVLAKAVEILGCRDDDTDIGPI